MYKNAPDDVLQAMLAMLKQDDISSRLANGLLICLATHGGEEVFHTFTELEKQPRKWQEDLYARPSAYAAYGGWSYDSDGNLLQTNFEKCYPMIKADANQRRHSPVKIGTKTTEKCSYCGCTVVNLMEIDGRDSRLKFLGIDGTIKAKCCPNCVMNTDGNFCRYSLDDESEIVYGSEPFTTEDYVKDSGIEELCSNSYILGECPVPPRYAADWEGGSSIGGFAFWIQDCDIRICPDCQKTMTYLAQIQWDTVLDGWEGNAYIEICKDCRLIAILHQQT